jgi:hypothetical protein
MDEREQAANQGAGRAARVELSDFAEALSSGVVRALERRPGSGTVTDWRPWIWAGWIIGPDGPVGPLSGGPFERGGGEPGG